MTALGFKRYLQRPGTQNKPAVNKRKASKSVRSGWEAPELQNITDCMTIIQEMPSIPQMKSMASRMCSSVATAPFHMGAW